MDYFEILNLKKEPFSNSPDPEFFFHSRQHIECLQKTELSLRLRRGLSVVIGDVGTGKTTLCRQLIRKFASDDTIETHLILDPYFTTELEFLSTMARTLGEHKMESRASGWQLKEMIKKYLFQRGVDEGKTVILIIDEGQKLPEFCLELLREFLNYETNEYKLLQIVIFAQKEFEQKLSKYKNFSDRINLYHTLDPLDFKGTSSMIRFRLSQANEGEKTPSFFNFFALWTIYRASEGYPRQIINLCHRIMLAMIVQNRSRAGWMVARSCSRRDFSAGPGKGRWARILVLTGLLALLFLFVFAPGFITVPVLFDVDTSTPGFVLKKTEVKRISIIRPVPNVHEEVSTGADFDKTPELSLERPVPEKKPPGDLGWIRAAKGETLGDMIFRVYGTFTVLRLKTVGEFNTKISDPNLIIPGQVIHFPAIPVQTSRRLPGFFWVQITVKDTLGKAYQFLRDNVGDNACMTIIPHWNSRDGLKFAIVNKKHFIAGKAARETLENLPPAIISGSKILSEWDEDTVFYANPLF